MLTHTNHLNYNLLIHAYGSTTYSWRYSPAPYAYILGGDEYFGDPSQGFPCNVLKSSQSFHNTFAIFSQSHMMQATSHKPTPGWWGCAKRNELLGGAENLVKHMVWIGARRPPEHPSKNIQTHQT